MKFLMIPVLIFLVVACSTKSEKRKQTTQNNRTDLAELPTETNSERDNLAVLPSDTFQITPANNSAKKEIEVTKNPKNATNPAGPTVPIDEPNNTTVIEIPAEPVYNFHDYENYESLLKDAVSSSGKVNYAKLKSRKAELEAVVKEFQTNIPDNSWSYKQKLAYWINAYNVFTLQIVVNNYPLKSIKDIGGSASTWDKKFIDLDGKKMSLNDIENGIIRKQFSEPRIHFAVNCASISCPKLLNRAFTANELESQLTKLTKEFLADNSKNTLDPKSPHISKLFDWYKEDFNAAGGVASFLSKYSNVEITSAASITYMEYNWGLND